MALPMQLGAAALCGVASHLLVFIHGEWERHTPRIPVVYGSLEAVLAAYLLRGVSTLLVALTSFGIINLGYFAGLFTSMIVYRVFFHKTRRYPGPFLAGVTGFWSAFVSTDFKFPLVVQELHQEYGDFVRIRPREISICDKDAVRDIHGPGSVCVRGPFYDFNHPGRSLQMTRDKVYHSQRRRIWDRGFSTNALAGYQPRVAEHCLKLISQLFERADKPVNITQWINYFAADVMGDLAFGKSFDMIGTAGDHFILSLFDQLKPVIGFTQCVPWLFVLFQNLPIISGKRKEWMRWCANQVLERKKLGDSRTDLCLYLLGYGVEGKKFDVNERDLIYDSELAIIAGSDTTSSTLAAILYLLAKHPASLESLQKEIDGLFEPYETISNQKLTTQAPILTGCINEALRLYPAVQTGVQRLTPPEGAKIAGQWIPGDTLVSTPTYALHRDARYFGKPDEFIPERWSSQPELIHVKEAFNPFLIGAYSCVGKNLAYMEMRLLTYYIVKNFTFNFPAGTEKEMAELFDSQQGFKDYFTASAPDFDLVFSPRSAPRGS